jgi:hypothetical protein
MDGESLAELKDVNYVDLVVILTTHSPPLTLPTVHARTRGRVSRGRVPN